MKTVQNGVQLLDEIEPGWYEKIDVGKLNLGDTYNCVLGQLETKKTTRFDRYSRKLNRIGGDVKEHPSKYGFTTQGNMLMSNLTRAWARVISERQKKAA